MSFFARPWPVALPLALACLILCLALDVYSADALAQAARKPFSVGGPEGVADASSLTQWILSWQASFKMQLTVAMKAAKVSGAAVWGLAALSFGYGVFHAAGPGHGKAVIASYMLANEQALKRGLVLSFLAALLQGVVAIALVIVASLVFSATAAQMNGATDIIEIASYSAIVLLGLWLVWRKGRALLEAWRSAARTPERNAGHVHTGHEHHHAVHDHVGHSHTPVAAAQGHVHDEHCGHFHGPDPASLGKGFSWGSAVATVFAAGSRPCSGAILVLVFALAQGILFAGIVATMAMALGTALTTGALAALAVLAKGVAARLAGPGSSRATLVLSALEALAAVLVLLLGALLLAGTLFGTHIE